jgi:hypothetical protein
MLERRDDITINFYFFSADSLSPCSEGFSLESLWSYVA